MVSWFVLKGLCGCTIIRSLFEAIFSQDVAKDGRYLSGIRYVPLKAILYTTDGLLIVITA